MSALCNEPFGCFEQKGYSQGFCECYKSPLLCIATFFCPCIVVGKVAGEMVGNDFALVPCLCAPLGTFRNRRLNVDRSNGESETVDASMMAVTCCHCCAIVQDAAEWQKHKEVNPSAGTAPQAVAEPEV